MKLNRTWPLLAISLTLFPAVALSVDAPVGSSNAPSRNSPKLSRYVYYYSYAGDPRRAVLALATLRQSKRRTGRNQSLQRRFCARAHLPHLSTKNMTKLMPSARSRSSKQNRSMPMRRHILRRRSRSPRRSPRTTRNPVCCSILAPPNWIPDMRRPPPRHSESPVAFSSRSRMTSQDG